MIFHQTEKLVLLFLFSLLSCNYVYGQVDKITAEHLEASVATYQEFNDVSISTSVKYAGGSAKSDCGAIQFRAKDKRTRGTGIVTTESEQVIKSVRIEWGDEDFSGYAVEVYGRNSAYKIKDAFEVPKPSYSSWGTKLLTIKKGDDRVYDLSARGYTHVGIKTNDGTVYLKSITFEWQKLKRNLHFEQSLYEVKYGEQFVSPQLQISATYSSSDKEVAVVDPHSGKVTVLGCGTTTISAYLSETEKYQAETVQYTLMVHPEMEHQTVLDFDKFATFFPGCTLDTPLPAVLSFQDGDCEIIIREGCKPSRFIEHDNENSIQLAEGAQLELRVPQGNKLTLTDLFFRKLSSSSVVLVKTDSINMVRYKITDKKGLCGKVLTVNYTGTYKVNIGSAGHATFSGSQSYVMPKGLHGGVVRVDGDSHKAIVNYCVRPGDVVAAHQAVILKGTPGEYTLVPSDLPGISFDETQNHLNPVSTSLAIAAQEGHRLYVLSRKSGQLGFYWQKGSEQGLNVTAIVNKAYLQLPILDQAAAKGYVLVEEETTGIEPQETTDTATYPVYTLSGVRVAESWVNLPRGIYIVKGKKVYVK